MSGLHTDSMGTLTCFPTGRARKTEPVHKNRPKGGCLSASRGRGIFRRKISVTEPYWADQTCRVSMRTVWGPLPVFRPGWLERRSRYTRTDRRGVWGRSNLPQKDAEPPFGDFPKMWGGRTSPLPPSLSVWLTYPHPDTCAVRREVVTILSDTGGDEKIKVTRPGFIIRRIYLSIPAQFIQYLYQNHICTEKQRNLLNFFKAPISGGFLI